MLQLHFSFSFSKFLMLEVCFSLDSVTFKVNHYINFYNVYHALLLLSVHTISDSVINYI